MFDFMARKINFVKIDYDQNWVENKVIYVWIYYVIGSWTKNLNININFRKRNYNF
jgi:hypothetical protein